VFWLERSAERSTSLSSGVTWLNRDDVILSEAKDLAYERAPSATPQDDRDRVVAQLAGAVAHKLKQPLAVAWGYLELMLDDPNLDLAPSTVRYLQEIQESLHQMDVIVNKLQQATTHQTRPYAGGLEILDLDL
jgi:signal transduction histidine kinase